MDAARAVVVLAVAQLLGSRVDVRVGVVAVPVADGDAVLVLVGAAGGLEAHGDPRGHHGVGVAGDLEVVGGVGRQPDRGVLAVVLLVTLDVEVVVVELDRPVRLEQLDLEGGVLVQSVGRDLVPLDDQDPVGLDPDRLGVDRARARRVGRVQVHPVGEDHRYVERCVVVDHVRHQRRAVVAVIDGAGAAEAQGAVAVHVDPVEVLLEQAEREADLDRDVGVVVELVLDVPVLPVELRPPRLGAVDPRVAVGVRPALSGEAGTRQQKDHRCRQHNVAAKPVEDPLHRPAGRQRHQFQSTLSPGSGPRGQAI